MPSGCARRSGIHAFAAQTRLRDAIERDGDALLQAAHADPALKEIPSAFYRYHLDSKDGTTVAANTACWACGPAPRPDMKCRSNIGRR